MIKGIILYSFGVILISLAFLVLAYLLKLKFK